MPTRSPGLAPAELDDAPPGVGDQVLGHLVAAHRRGAHAPHQAAAAHGLLAGRQRVDRHRRAMRGDQARRAARERRHDQRVELELARRLDGAVGDRVARVARVARDARLVPAPVGRLALGRARDRVHHLHRLDRVGADRRLLREHHGVGAVEDRVGHVCDLGARRPRRADHRVEHLGRRDRRPRVLAAEPQQPLLDHRHLLDRQLDPEVSARDHDAVGDADDVLGARDRLRLLDLRDQRDPRVLADVEDVLGAADEAQRHEVDADLDAGAQVLEVLLGHRWQLVGGAGDVEALARCDDAAELDLAVEFARVGARRQHAQAHRAVGEVDGCARLQRGRETGPADRHALGVARVVVGRGGGERDRVTAAQHDLVVGERSDADLRAGEVLEDRDRAPGAARGLAHQRRRLRVRLVRAVAEVQARDVHAGLDHPHEHLGVERCGPDRGDDLGAALHRALTLLHRGRGPGGAACRRVARRVRTR